MILLVNFSNRYIAYFGYKEEVSNTMLSPFASSTTSVNTNPFYDKGFGFLPSGTRRLVKGIDRFTVKDNRPNPTRSQYKLA